LETSPKTSKTKNIGLRESLSTKGKRKKREEDPASPPSSHQKEKGSNQKIGRGYECPTPKGLEKNTNVQGPELDEKRRL